MARGILAPPRHCGARMRPHAYLMSNAHSVHRRPTPSCGHPVCLARVGPHLKSVTHSVCPHLAMIPHGTPDVPTCLAACPQYLPTVRRRPTAAHLSQRTLMDGLNPITRLMSWITRP
ncbi:UNVERIFIED_CONTAM: hypothetical protein Sradi_1755200 [Sesamum radiatum]|uniref:Uncharacterized protein n=1 Tax=Sesamum radiatum TaxID=300843 RepID=A0AAW2TT84_SESRA